MISLSSLPANKFLAAILASLAETGVRFDTPVSAQSPNAKHI
jgi:hypothetical protein